MRLLVDVLGAPESSGGMRLYAEEIIRAWNGIAPNDELTVIGGPWVKEAFDTRPGVSVIVAASGGTLRRILSQLVWVGLRYRSGRFSAVLSVSPMVTPLAPRSNRFVVVHDWRHLKNPSEFGIAQRFYRKFWRRSVATAATAFVISRKTALETGAIVPTAHAVMAQNGADHVRTWLPVDRAPVPAQIVTFGHHSNKRPELLIRAMAIVVESGHKDISLTVLGAQGGYRDSLRQLAKDFGVGDYCTFPGFVSDTEYQRLIQSASLVALVSSDEGFGLPVSEAGYFGIPCIATNDSGLDEVHGDAVFTTFPTGEALAQGILTVLQACPQGSVRRPIQSWRTTAAVMRSEVVAQVGK